MSVEVFSVSSSENYFGGGMREGLVMGASFIHILEADPNWIFPDSKDPLLLIRQALAIA